MIKCEIVTIGDEILIGQIVDTNSAYIGEKFNEIGVPINSITSIKDNQTDITAQLKLSLERSDIVIVTGGLGPTKDDITKNAIAEMFNCSLKRDQKTFEHVKAMVKSRGLEFNASNQAQADVPECATVIKNNHGTAPAMMFEQNNHLLFCLPGVPFEMEYLLENVIEIIKQHFKLKSIIHKTILVYGLSESVLSETISEWECALPNYLHLAYLPNPRGIRLRLSAYDVDKFAVDTEIQKQFSTLSKVIPTNIVGICPISIEENIAEILVRRGETLSIAESCTGGMISSRITTLAGSSRYFLGSVVGYANEVKVNVIDVNSCDLEKYGAVSEQVAIQMAIGVKKLTGSDYSIATTGVAGPDGGSEEKPVGTVWFAVAHKNGVETMKMNFCKLRQQNIESGSSYALNMLRLLLLNNS